MRVLRAIRGSFDKYWYGWAMAAPVVIVMLVLVGYPFVWGVYLSTTNADESNIGHDIGVNHIAPSYKSVGLHNYWDILSGNDGHFYSTLSWTLIWTFVNVFCHIAIGLALAILLNRRIRFRAGYRLMLILPWAIPGFVAAFAWRLLYNDNGVFNAVLKYFGMHGVQWLSQPTSAKVAVIAVNVWMGVPFMMVSFLGGLQTIPSELYEAAEMDGANKWAQFRNVTLPGLSQVMIFVITTTILASANMFGQYFMVTKGAPGTATRTVIGYIADEGLRSFRMGSAAAMSYILAIILLIVSVINFRLFRDRGVS